MMSLTVTGRHLDISTAARQQIDRRLTRLRRLMNDNALSAQCILTRERGRVVCELTIHARGDHTLVAVGRHASLPSAVGLAAEKVAQQATRLIDRWKTRRRTTPPTTAPAETTPPVPRARVIRARHYAVKPMTVDDAVLALADGPGAFVVFRHLASESVAVLFRRPDGHLGLIDTES
jgi:putative sigma-54 modulation protein